VPFWNRNGIGLSVSETQIAMVEAKRRGTGVEVGRYAVEMIGGGLLRPSPVEQNIGDLAQGRTHMRALLERFPAVRRIALALPDAVVRVLVLNLQQTPKQRADFERLIRWHMEKTFLHPLGAARFSYQVLPHPKTGWKVIATAVKQDIIAQYEALCEGREIVHIAPASFSLLNLFDPLIASHHVPHAVVAYWFDRSLTLFIFEAGLLNFVRVKEFPEGDASQSVSVLIREIGTSLSFYEGIGDPSLRPTHLFLLMGSAADPTLTTQLGAALPLTPVLLDVRQVVRKSPAIDPHEPLSDAVMSAAAAAVAM